MKKLIFWLILILCTALFFWISWWNKTRKSSEENIAVVEKSRVENPYWKRTIAEYERYINKIMAETGTPGCAVAIVKDRKISWIRGFGVKSAGTTDSIDQNTVFRIASVSKGFASMLTGILAEEGKLKFNDPLVNYLPEMKLQSATQTKKVTLKHVLSHTMGLPYQAYTNLVETGMPLREILPKLYSLDLIGKEGTIYSYQNVAYSIIGEVTEKTSGKDFPTLIKEKIFDPLHMFRSSVSYKQIMQEKNKALPHARGRGGWRPIDISETYYNVAPAGGINSSIGDMAEWLLALMGGHPQVISTQMLDTLYQPLIVTPIKNRYFRLWQPFKKAYYAMGWRILQFPDHKVVYHGGYVNGYRSEIAFIPDEGLGIVLLVNAPSSLPNYSIPKFFEIYHRYESQIIRWDLESVESEPEGSLSARNR